MPTVKARAPLVVLLSLLFGCGSWKRTGSGPNSVIGEDVTSHVEVTIYNLTQAQAEAFLEQIDDAGDVENVKIKSRQGDATVYEMDVDGCECELPAMVAKIATPGFKYEGRVTQLRFAAFDNVAPVITFVHPEEGKVVADKDQLITVECADPDVVEVKVNGVIAPRYKGHLWRTKLNLQDGVNEVTAVAKDKAGNEGKAQIRVAVDTTPPEVQATFTMVIEGTVEPGSTVLIDGKEAEVDSKGHYRMEVPVKKGQRSVEIVAIDPSGNKSVTERELGN
jgi:hypothetical protein